jgi:deoxyribonuclease V
VAELTATQEALAVERPAPWLPSVDSQVAGCFAAFPRGRSGPGEIGDPVWAGAAAFAGTRCVARATGSGRAGWPYVPGLLALRIGPTLDAVVRALPAQPDVLLVDATGRDHPRRCGLALQLGAALGIPTVGVTHRTLLAEGDWPDEQRGSVSPLLLAGTLVGYLVRTRRGRRPLAVHAAWRTDPDCAARVVLDTCRHRTPRPLREARRLARQARSDDAGVSREARFGPAANSP